MAAARQTAGEDQEEQHFWLVDALAFGVKGSVQHQVNAAQISSRITVQHHDNAAMFS